MLAHLRAWAAKDDGREFVMHNVVRYRAQAQYPAHLAHLGTDPRAADQRYARRIIGPLLRQGSFLVWVARRKGRFIEPDGMPDWHYVAMVRYRSLRDFLRFACVIERGDIVVHKWAAIETTQVFPTQPILSLGSVRLLVALILGLGVWAAHGALALLR